MFLQNNIFYYEGFRKGESCLSRAGSLNHFSGEPDRGAPNFSQSQRGIFKITIKMIKDPAQG